MTKLEQSRCEVEEALTLSPAYYRDAGHHALESERIFAHAWVCVGYAQDLREPGSVITALVDDQPVVIARGDDGVLRGFFNTCRHRGSLLVEEARSTLKRFRCPYHSWTYDLSGRLVHCPLFEQSQFNKAEYGLLSIRVSEWGAFVFACLAKETEPLADYLGDLVRDYQNFPFDKLVRVRRKSYEINANWKLIAENFLEYYHLPWVHPELCQVAAIDMHKRNQGAGMYMSFYASPLLPGQTPLDADFLPPMPKLSDEQKQSGYFPLVFPNLAMFIMPHHVFVLLMNPLSINKTQEYADLLVHESLLKEPDVERKLDEIFKFYDMVNMQDIRAVELVQKGLHTKNYPGGHMSYRFEEPVFRFQSMCSDFLRQERRCYRAD